MRGVAVALLLAAATAHAQAPAPAPLADAQARFADADYATAARLAGALAREASLPRADRAEAYRIYGLSLFFLGLRDEADAALLAYLRLEPDAHLDPALVPPDAIVFFEGVRARHAGEIARQKPRPKRRRYLLLNLAPPYGQVQNGERTKAWVLGGVEVALLATNITTYALLAGNCERDLTCSYDRDEAKALRAANLLSGGLFVGALIYGVVDGWIGFHRLEREEAAARLVVVPEPGGASVLVRF